MSDNSPKEPPLTREERIEVFSEEYVEHTEWWTEQTEIVEDVLDDILEVIDERKDARVTRRGVSTKNSGRHELKLRVTVAGDPWESDSEEM